MEDREQERKALTFDDRLAIERGLNRGDTISWIARTIGRAPKVVREEVRRNWTSDPVGHLVVNTRNICVHEGLCERRHLCRPDCWGKCSRCRQWRCYLCKG